MDENSIYEALGLEGGNEQEVAEPAAEETETTSPEATQESAEPEEKETVQSPEERSRQAYGRRQREREEAAREAVTAERGKTSDLLKRLGITDPETGEPVDTIDKLEQYERSLSSLRIAAGKPTESDIARVAREAVGAEKPQPKQMSKDEMQAVVDRQIAEIHKLDPSVSSLDDILKGEYGAEFRRAVQEKNLSFIEAYKQVSYGKMSASQQKAAEQAARNRAASKDHLGATVMRGQGSNPVPRDQMEIFRALMPDVADAEFEKYYNR